MGIASARGVACEFLRLVEIVLVEIVLSRQVNIAVDRNITSKLAECLDEFRAYLETVALAFLDDPLAGAVKPLFSLIYPGEAPALAAAVSAKTAYLAMWDRKHFLAKDTRVLTRPKVLNLGEFLHEFRSLIEKGP